MEAVELRISGLNCVELLTELMFQGGVASFKEHCIKKTKKHPGHDVLIQRIIPLFVHSIQMVLERGSDQLWQVTLDILFHDHFRQTGCVKTDYVPWLNICFIVIYLFHRYSCYDQLVQQYCLLLLILYLLIALQIGLLAY